MKHTHTHSACAVSVCACQVRTCFAKLRKSIELLELHALNFVNLLMNFSRHRAGRNSLTNSSCCCWEQRPKCGSIKSVAYFSVLADKNFCVTHTTGRVCDRYTTTEKYTNTHTHTLLAVIMFGCPAGLLPVSVSLGNRQL